MLSTPPAFILSQDQTLILNPYFSDYSDSSDFFLKSAKLFWIDLGCVLFLNCSVFKDQFLFTFFDFFRNRHQLFYHWCFTLSSTFLLFFKTFFVLVCVLPFGQSQEFIILFSHRLSSTFFLFLFPIVLARTFYTIAYLFLYCNTFFQIF